MGERHPARIAVAEVLALAEDGYIEVVADDDGYTIHKGQADSSMLWPDRAEVLAGLLSGSTSVRLDRPELPPLAPPQGPISADRISTAISETAGQYGFISRTRWLVVVGAVVGVGGALTAMVTGLWSVAWPVATGTGLLLTIWLKSPIRLSTGAHSERERLHALREQLREGPGAADQALLPWAFLLLPEDERNRWWRRVRPVSDQPHWLTWRPVRAGVWPGLMTDVGLSGLARAVAHRMGP